MKTYTLKPAKIVRLARELPVTPQTIVNLFDGELERYEGEFSNFARHNTASGTEYVNGLRAHYEEFKTCLPSVRRRLARKRRK